MEGRYRDIHAGLIASCKDNDRAAQQELYRLYAKAMYNTAYRILRNEEDAKDIVQEGFIDMFSKLYTFRGESSFGAWFKRIVVNKSLNFVKKKRHILVDVSELELEEEIDVPQNFDYAVSDVKQAMNNLPEGYRLVFDLYMFEGYTHKEIASELGIAENTSKSQLSRARVKLVELLNNLN